MIEKAKQEDGEGQDLFQKRRQSRKLSTQVREFYEKQKMIQGKCSLYFAFLTKLHIEFW